MVEPFLPGRQSLQLSLIRRIFANAWQRGYRQTTQQPEPFADMEWFYAWAGALMVRDLAPRVQNPDSWWQPQHLKDIQH